jgi:hypothetical protein
MWLANDEVVTRWRMLPFITFISSIWHPWLMTKWTGCPIIIQWLKNDYKSFDMNKNNPNPAPHVPTYLRTYLFTYPPTHPSINLPTCLPTKPPTYHLSMHPPTYLPTTFPPTCLPSTHDPPTYLPTYLLFPIYYNLPTSYLSSYHLLLTS